MTASGGNGVSFPDSLPQSPAGNSQAGNLNNNNLRNRKRPLKRLVSQDELRIDNKISCTTPTKTKFLRCSDLPRRVSEMDESNCEDSSKVPPVVNNPLHNNLSGLNTHVSALRLEADLFPMRLILSRLMMNPTHNKKGLFNHPVDPVALKLVDYHLYVARPMDLGSVKIRLHGLAYKSRKEVAEDIRLVFRNAMSYNPPHNIVHKCASELSTVFEEYYGMLGPCVSEPENDDSSKLLLPTVSEEVQKQPTATTTQSVACLAPNAPSLQNAAISEGQNSSQESEVQKKQPLESQAGSSRSSLASSTSTLIPHVLPPRRRRSSLLISLPHFCQTCNGRQCKLCKQGCLKHEPCILVCQGRHCSGAKIRKGSIYFISDDGTRQYCEKCFTSLPPVLSQPSSGDAPLYKQDLLKRKNNEEIVEEWLTCSKCTSGVHAICAMYNSSIETAHEYECPSCKFSDVKKAVQDEAQDAGFTFVSGSADPVPIAEVGPGRVELSSDSLEECSISSFIQQKVRDCMKDIPNADKTVNVRVISNCTRNFSIPEVVRKYFRMATESDGFVEPPSKVSYQQKAITLFQKIDGLDVCVFCMYVQEYDGDDQYDCHDSRTVQASHRKRVYISYLDSVEYFRPRQCRTQVYHEILVAYLATARERGYEMAQIWACPPSRGNSFVFWNHPASQRTPTKERLVSWYHDVLSHSVACGVVTDVKSLFESEFEKMLLEMDNRTTCGRILCPPLLDGDFWIDEAVRIHDASIARNLKIRSPSEVCVWHVTPLTSEDLDPCPTMQVATLIKDRVMTHPCSVPFRRPVNAAALKLKDYHKIVTNPVDLGTIYSRCVIGEYQVLQEVVDDVRLMVANAKKFNPSGHFVYTKAEEVLELFFQELASLVKIWNTIDSKECASWESYADLSMNLEFSLDMPKLESKTTSVVIEDDRSSDGSRSTASSSSVQTSPVQSVKEAEPVASCPQTAVPAPPTKPTKVARKPGRKRKDPPKKLGLLEGGSEAIMQSMVGKDLWLVDKRVPTPPKIGGTKKTRKRRRSSIDAAAEDPTRPTPKKLRQSWLGEEVGESVRKLRTSLFTCSLVPKDVMSDKEQVKLEGYREYVKDFAFESERPAVKTSPITDTRQGLLELFQYRHYEFDTLRRAKHSTAMLIYHLLNTHANAVIPVCTSCDQDIENVRWHKVKAMTDRTVALKATQKQIVTDWVDEELCGCCHQQHDQKEEFIPIPVQSRK